MMLEIGAAGCSRAESIGEGSKQVAKDSETCDQHQWLIIPWTERRKDPALHCTYLLLAVFQFCTIVFPSVAFHTQYLSSSYWLNSANSSYLDKQCALDLILLAFLKEHFCILGPVITDINFSYAESCFPSIFVHAIIYSYI